MEGYWRLDGGTGVHGDLIGTKVRVSGEALEVEEDRCARREVKAMKEYRCERGVGT